MSDGRAITATWQPNAIANSYLIQSNSLRSNWQYREFLQKNALDIMKQNFEESSNDSGYYKRPVDLPSIQSNQIQQSHINPARYSSVLDTNPVLGSTNSDLKVAYLTREQLDARKVSPIITQSELFRSNTGNLSDQRN
jgi:hypothetical protein